MQQRLQKPSYDEWMYWSQVIIDRITTIVHVYNKPPHLDVFMPGNERQFKVSQAVDILRRLHALTDENDLRSPKDSTPEQLREDQVIADLQPLFRDILRRMSAWSSDMQLLLKSPWYDRCVGQTATVLFRGPDDRLAEGVGSGMPEHGRLPEVIREFLEREQMGETRAPMESHILMGDQPLRRDELATQWERRNRTFLSSAGRVD